MMPDGLYERDVLAWSERQSALLRRLAAGERLNKTIDWPNIIEEMEDLAEMYSDALGQPSQSRDESGPPQPLPSNCPLTPDNLLDPCPDVLALVAKLAPA